MWLMVEEIVKSMGVGVKMKDIKFLSNLNYQLYKILKEARENEKKNEPS